MTLDALKKKKLPDSPGVYFFRSARRKILYIGRATSLKDRVKSYFSKEITAARGGRIALMVEKASSVDCIQTDSVLESLILEANLIKKHKPPYNTDSKDDKSFNYVLITDEEFPRVLLKRGHDLRRGVSLPVRTKRIFGPFPKGTIFKEGMKIIRKLFPYFDTAQPIGKQNKHEAQKMRFNRQIGLYPDLNITKTEYARTIRHIVLFFEGKKSALIKELAREMNMRARRREFEKAAKIKRQLFGLRHIQDISLIKEDVRAFDAPRAVRIEAYDVAHTGGKDMVGVMTVVEDGEIKKADYRQFKIRSVEGANDTAALSEALDRRLGHTEWPMPSVIVFDGGKAQYNAARRVLGRYDMQIPVVAVVKDERHRAKNMLGSQELIQKHGKDILRANAESHRFALSFHRKTRSHRLR